MDLWFSFGTEWYDPPAVIIAVAGWALLTRVTRRDGRRLLGQAGVLAGVVLLAGGFWLVRNLVELGNPFFPLKVSVGGLTLFDAPRDIRREISGLTLAGYVDDPAVWRRV